jgi:hypothetical protein
MNERQQLTNQIAASLVAAFLNAPTNVIDFSFLINSDDKGLHSEVGSYDLLGLVDQVDGVCKETLLKKEVVSIDFTTVRNVVKGSTPYPVFRTTLSFQVILKDK